MPRETEHSIRLGTDTKFPSLYGWCLQEVDEHGDQIGRDYPPWSGNVWFGLDQLHYSLSYERDRYGIDPERSVNRKISERIFADLVVREKGILGKTTLSFIGFAEPISRLSLTIRPGDEEYCNTFGYPELDDTYGYSESVLFVDIVLKPDTFSNYVQLIQSGTVAGGTLVLKGVPGFYAEWTPEIYTDKIKVLSEQTVANADTADVEARRLDVVEEYSLTLHTRPIAYSVPDIEDGGPDMANELEDDPETNSRERVANALRESAEQSVRQEIAFRTASRVGAVLCVLVAVAAAGIWLR